MMVPDSKPIDNGKEENITVNNKDPEISGEPGPTETDLDSQLKALLGMPLTVDGRRRNGKSYIGKYGLARDLKLVKDYRDELLSKDFKFKLRLFGRTYNVIKVGKSIYKAPAEEYDRVSVPTVTDVASSLKVANKRIVFPGSVPVAETLHGVAWSSGISMIVGPGNAGKTPLCRDLLNDVDKYIVIRAGEPLALYESDPDEIVSKVLLFLMGSCNVGILDSIKDIIALGGSLMKQGVSRQALVEISSLSSLCCTFAKALLVPFNVSSSDPEMIDSAVEMARSNSTGYLYIKSSDAQFSTWEGTLRTGEGLDRISVSLRYSRSGEITITRGTRSASLKQGSGDVEKQTVVLESEHYPINLNLLSDSFKGWHG